MHFRSKLFATCLAAALLAGCGGKGMWVGGPMGVVAVGKLQAQSLRSAKSIFSQRHLVVRMAPGARPPVAGVRVKPGMGDRQVHVLPKGTSFDQALAAYQQAGAVKTIERLELFPQEDEEPVTPPVVPAPGVPKGPVPQLPVNDPYYYQQWSHFVAQVPLAWQTTKGNKDVVVAVLDTGVDYDHPDLDGQIIDGPDFAEDADTSKDIDQHGTHVAGIIAANANDGMGVAGVAPGCRVLSLKVFEPVFEGETFKGCYTNEFALARAIQYAATQGGAKILNISAGIPNDGMVRTMLNFARGQGLILCVSAGNNGNNVYSGSAKDMDGVLVAHATDPQDRLARFSNYGSTLAVSAPGMSILSTVPTYPSPFTNKTFGDAGYDALSGTSMASPFVAGVAALVVSAMLERAEAQLANGYHVGAKLMPRDISGRVVEDLIRSTCYDLGVYGRDEVYGCGRVDAHRAMLACSDGNWVDRVAREYIQNRER